MHRGPLMLILALLVSSASASASVIVRRGIEATTLHGGFVTVSDPTAPDQQAIVIGPGTVARRTLDIVRARAIDVTLAGCGQGSIVLLRVDRDAPIPLFAGRGWHVVAVRQASLRRPTSVRAGRQALRRLCGHES